MDRFRQLLPTIVLLLLAIFTTAFAFMNFGNHVRVWPLGSSHPLTVVIAVAFALGGVIGALLTSVLHHRRIPSANVVPAEPINVGR